MEIESMRDPGGDVRRYAGVIESIARSEKSMRGGMTKAPLAVRLLYHFRQFDFSMNRLTHLYGAGAPLNVIRDEVISRTAMMLESSRFLKFHADHPRSFNPYPLDGVKRGSIGFIALALLLVSQDDFPEQLWSLASPEQESRSYLLDSLFKAYIPDHSLAPKHETDRYAAVWMTPVVRILALPAELRPQALNNHLKSWCRIMRPWGWKPDLDTSGEDNLFCDFAFEVALAVCAYDIDDRLFQDHLYYPRDLVEYYRSNVRHTRDLWRAEGVGSGAPIIAPPVPINADLGKSTRKGVARWVELVCDGNIDTTKSVLEVLGKPYKFDDITVLMEALNEAGQVIHADNKDDKTTLIQADQAANDRGLGEFDGPAGPPFGPARCRAALLSFSLWLDTRDYCLIDLDNDDDAWHAVVVKAGYYEEFVELSNALKIRTRTPNAAYGD